MTPNILVAPSYGKPSARRHFHDTIAGWVPFADDERGPLLTDEEREHLLALHPSGVAHFWGATEGHADMMKQLRRGDVVLFTGDNKVKAYGEVGYVFRNQKFADKLWWKEGDTDSFVHAYSVVNVRMVERPKSDLVTLCGYKPGYEFPGQRFLRAEDVPKVLIRHHLGCHRTDRTLPSRLASRIPATRRASRHDALERRLSHQCIDDHRENVTGPRAPRAGPAHWRPGRAPTGTSGDPAHCRGMFGYEDLGQQAEPSRHDRAGVERQPADLVRSACHAGLRRRSRRSPPSGRRLR
ncbi:hypothetical protein AB0H12_37050 [Actinosynnema sp. NPDC023794]